MSRQYFKNQQSINNRWHNRLCRLLSHQLLLLLLLITVQCLLCEGATEDSTKILDSSIRNTSVTSATGLNEKFVTNENVAESTDTFKDLLNDGQLQFTKDNVTSIGLAAESTTATSNETLDSDPVDSKDIGIGTNKSSVSRMKKSSSDTVSEEESSEQHNRLHNKNNNRGGYESEEESDEEEKTSEETPSDVDKSTKQNFINSKFVSKNSSEEIGGGDSDDDEASESEEDYEDENTYAANVCTAEYFLNKIIPEDYPEEITKDVHHINETIERINRMYTFSSKMMENFKPLIRELASRFSEFIYESKIDSNCMGAMFRVITSIRDRKSWALSFLDASGNVFSGGFQEGMFVSFGEFDQCLEIQSDDRDGYYRPVKGQYCLLKPMIPIPDEMKYQKGEHFAKSKLKTVDRFLNEEYMQTYVELFKFLKKTILRIGICMPHRCDPKSVEDAINQFLVRKTGLSVQIGPHCVRADDEVILDYYQIVTLFIICFVFVLILISTVYELIQRGLRDYAMQEDTKSRTILPTSNTRNASAKIRLLARKFSRQLSTSYMEQSIHSQLLTTFSLVRNTRVLFDIPVNRKRLLPLDTMRLLLILFFFICNSYYFTLVFAPMLVKRFYALGPLQFFTQKKYLFIRMIYMADCLVAFSGIGIALSFNARKFNLFQYYLRNYLRYLLPILFSIGLIYIAPLLGNGPLWHLFDDTLSLPCRNNLLPTLLFFNNLNENIEETCNFPTVFISMIFQLQLIAPLFLFIANRFRPGNDLTILILITGTFSAFNAVPRLFFDEKIPYEIKTMTSFTEIKHSLMYYLFHPMSHIAQFLFGLTIGTLIKLKLKGLITLKFRHIMMSGLGSLALWIFHTANMSNISVLHFEVPFVQMIPMLAFGYIFTCSFLCWLIVASDNLSIINRFFSSIAFRPMCQLSYGFFVTSIVVACFRLFSIRQNVILSPQNMFRAIVSDAVVSFLLSYVIHVMIQQPYRNLINLDWSLLWIQSSSSSPISPISPIIVNHLHHRKNSEMSDSSQSDVINAVSELIQFKHEQSLDDNLNPITFTVSNQQPSQSQQHPNHPQRNTIAYIDQMSLNGSQLDNNNSNSRKNSDFHEETSSILLNDLNNNYTSTPNNNHNSQKDTPETTKY